MGFHHRRPEPTLALAEMQGRSFPALVLARAAVCGGGLLAMLAGALWVVGCGDSTSPTSPPLGPIPTAIQIRGLPQEPFEVGAVVQLTAWATFSDGASQQVDPVWSSSTPAVASVDQNGFVFAHAGGETRITAVLGPATTEAGVTVAPANPDIYDLSGQVFNHNGRPVAGVLVVALDGPAAGRGTVTAGDGWYTLHDLEGDTSVAARKDGYEEEIGLATRQSGRLHFMLAGGDPRDAFGGGQWIVGDEILPGRYFTDPDPGCFWQRRAGFSVGALSGAAALLPFDTEPDHDFIAGRELRFDSRQEIVDISPGDAAFRSTSECGIWSREPPEVATEDTIHPGKWLVGHQIAPGTYRAGAGFLCYWARLSGFAAIQEDILEEGLVESEVGAELMVTIEDSDAGFTTDDDCGPWVRVEDPP